MKSSRETPDLTRMAVQVLAQFGSDFSPTEIRDVLLIAAHMASAILPDKQLLGAAKVAIVRELDVDVSAARPRVYSISERRDTA